MQAHNKGEEHLTKAELMARADKAGIAEKPIYGMQIEALLASIQDAASSAMD